jgi:hypothetical protein
LQNIHFDKYQNKLAPCLRPRKCIWIIEQASFRFCLANF